MPDRPRVAVTVGDAGGIGIEVALKAVADPNVTSVCRPVLYGPADVIAATAADLGLSATEPKNGPDNGPGTDVVDVGGLDGSRVVRGEFDAATGAASYQAVLAAIDDALAEGRCDDCAHEPELLRMRGELLLKGGRSKSDAAELFEKACKLAEEMGALLYAVRAATSQLRLALRTDAEERDAFGTKLRDLLDQAELDHDLADYRRAQKLLAEAEVRRSS